MILIEVFAPFGTLDRGGRQRLGSSLIASLLPDAGGPQEVCFVVFQDCDAIIGGWASDRVQGPRFVVRVNVPGSHMSDAMRAETVARITHGVQAVVPEASGAHEQPAVWVHIVEVADGNMGVFGRVVRIGDLVKLAMNRDFRPGGANHDAASGTATVIDPICGMTVELGPDAVTVEHGGTVHGFCSTACRDRFVADHAAGR